MKFFNKRYSKRLLLFVDIALVLLGFFYFLFFVNKGLVLSDEGYYVHYAERIARGEIPYKDFVLQYSPGYFYLLGYLYKIFGAQILIGRFISLLACLGIVISALVLLHLYRIKSKLIHILTALTLIFLSYSLLHLPLVIWISVLLSLQLVITYIYWLRKREYKFVVLLGLLLALILLFRQNVGFVFIVILNLLMAVSTMKQWRYAIIPLLLLNIVWVIIIGFFVGIYVLSAGNVTGILQMFAMSKHFLDTYPFTYPPLTYLFEPTGVFKLLPYYFPIVYLLLVIVSVYKKQFSLDRLAFALIVLSGFFVTVYPASDLLHVYPFLGVTLVSSLVFYYKKSGYKLLLVILPIFILLGFYLTFFTKSYRYEGYFLRQTKPLELPKTAGILIDDAEPDMKYLPFLYEFVQGKTKKNDYIFVYPFFPMLYFALDRQNPNGIVQYILLEAPSDVYSEERVISEIKKKQVRYIITAGPYDGNKKIGRFIQQQKKVRTIGSYIVYEIDK